MAWYQGPREPYPPIWPVLEVWHHHPTSCIHPSLWKEALFLETEAIWGIKALWDTGWSSTGSLIPKPRTPVSTRPGVPCQGADTLLVHCLTVLISSWITRSTHFRQGSFSLTTCFFTMASNARSGVKSPVLKPSEPGGKGDKSERNKARSAISQARGRFPRKNQGHGKSDACIHYLKTPRVS